MNDNRPEADKALGVIRVTFAGEQRMLPTLKIASAREWKSRLLGAVGGNIAEFYVEGQTVGSAIKDLGSLAVIGSDLILDLVLEYDKAGALGGREWMEEHADDSEVYRLLKTMAGVHFPYVADLQAAMTEVYRMFVTTSTASPSAPEESTSTPSSPGVSRQPRSKTPSTRRN